MGNKIRDKNKKIKYFSLKKRWSYEIMYIGRDENEKRNFDVVFINLKLYI